MLSKYLVRYSDFGGGTAVVWVDASSPEDAEFKVRNQYFDFKELIECYEDN